MTRRLEGTPVAEKLLAQSREAAREGEARGWPPPTLASVHLGTGTPFEFYLRRQRKAAEAAGVAIREVVLSPTTTARELAAQMDVLDQDPLVHGVLLEHPLPPQLDFAGAISRLRPEKDVDGVGHPNLGSLVAGTPLHVPAVARAARAILAHYDVPIRGRRVVVIGRSPTVGIPLALLFALRGPQGDATVTIAHSASPPLAPLLSSAEIVVSCAGQPGLLRRDTVPASAIVVDVGLSSVPDPERPGRSRTAGDADPSLDGWVEALTPVPGGVGPVTVAELFGNLVRGWTALQARGA
jgi:methylenetetrahydrofolate dehydrogenase (NADP+) / methenyltetrahydrofolate cyclohydrolase